MLLRSHGQTLALKKLSCVFRSLLIQDRFAVSHTIYASPQPSAFVRPSIEATPIAEQQIIEIPRWLAAQGVIAGDVSFEEDKRLIYLAKQPTASDLLFDALVSIDGGATYSEDSSNAEFAEAALIAEEYGAMDTGPLKIKEVTDSTILANASSTQVRAGANMLIVGDEIIAYETFTDNLDRLRTTGHGQEQDQTLARKICLNGYVKLGKSDAVLAETERGEARRLSGLFDAVNDLDTPHWNCAMKLVPSLPEEMDAAFSVIRKMQRLVELRATSQSAAQGLRE
jgi:hypothetical protein